MKCSRMLCGALLAGLVWLHFPACAQENAADTLKLLFEATQSAERLAKMNVSQLEPTLAQSTDPLWPVLTFLRGEVLRLRSDSNQALSAYQALAEWAAADPYADTWGGSGLATVALWRWAQALAGQSTPDVPQVERLLRAAGQLKPTRFMKTFFQMAYAVVETFPQLEEDLIRQLARVAYAAGKTEAAEQYFLEYLSMTRTAKLDATETALYNALIESGLAAADRLAFLRGKRLMTLKVYPEADALLRQAQASTDLNLQAEATLYLARLQRYQGENRENVAALLDQAHENAVAPELIQEILYERAVVWNREGKGRNEQAFLADVQQLVEEFPAGALTDDALYQLAQYYETNGDLENALDTYKQIREFPGANDWINTAYFRPALLLYSRGASGDLRRAINMLNDLETDQPNGQLHLSALFWLGRLTEEAGDAKSAAAYFQQIIAETPYDYYAIRARMHLELGSQAITQLWPTPAIQQALRKAYQPDQTTPMPLLTSPYALRLHQAVTSGLYHKAFAADGQLREQFPSQRQEALTLAQLDQAGLLTPLALLLALRQDALAAKDREADLTTWPALVRFAGQQAGDWPLAMNMVLATGGSSAKIRAFQHAPAYLAAAYPPLFKEAILKASRESDAPPAMVYSIIRRESLFYPAALSPRNGLGLFQFIPATFTALDQRWGLLKARALHAREAFLMNPEFSIQLGARWVRQELLNRYQKLGYTEAMIPLALMDHNAGYPAVKSWIERWKQEGRTTDLEYMLETVRFAETRLFTRRVLADMIIVDAIGVLK